MTNSAQDKGRTRCPQRAAAALTLTQACRIPDAGRARRSARAAVEAHDCSPAHRALTSTIATIILSFILALLSACATDTTKATASTKLKPQFKVVVATNDAPLAPPWQMPAPVQQQDTAAQPTENQNSARTQIPTPTQAPTPPPRVRILPLTARIASVNEKLRYVIVDFTNSRQPIPDERLGVYRVGEKVAEIKISGPYRNTTVAADIVAGEVKYGDEVKKE